MYTHKKVKNIFHKLFVYIVIISFLNLSFFQIISYSQTKLKPTVAVLNFYSNTGNRIEDAMLSFGTAETVITDLSHVNSIQVVDRSYLKDINKEIMYSQSGMIDKERIIKVGKQIGAQYIVRGHWQRYGNQYRLNVKIVEVETTKILPGIMVDGYNPLDMQVKIVSNILKNIKVGITRLEAKKIVKSDTKSIDAFKQFSLGLREYDYGDSNKSQIYMKKAIEIDPDYQKPKEYLYTFYGYFGGLMDIKAETLRKARAKCWKRMMLIFTGGSVIATFIISLFDKEVRSSVQEMPQEFIIVSAIIGSFMGLIMSLINCTGKGAKKSMGNDIIIDNNTKVANRKQESSVDNLEILLNYQHNVGY